MFAGLFVKKNQDYEPKIIHGLLGAGGCDSGCLRGQ